MVDPRAGQGLSVPSGEESSFRVGSLVHGGYSPPPLTCKLLCLFPVGFAHCYQQGWCRVLPSQAQSPSFHPQPWNISVSIRQRGTARHVYMPYRKMDNFHRHHGDCDPHHSNRLTTG